MGSVLSTVEGHLAPVTDFLKGYLPQDTSLTTRTAIIFTTALLVGYLTLGPKRRNLPPGPFAFPLVGNMPQLAGIKDPFKFMLKLRQRYGDIVRVKVGTMTMLVVFGPRLVREVMVTKGNAIANRPNWIYIIDKIFKGRGVFWGNGESWRHLRKFTVGTLRDFGVGKRSLEERIVEECGILAEEWKKTKGASFKVKPLLADAISNVMCGIVFGERFEYSDPEFKRLLGYLDYLFNNAGIQVPENFFPWISYFRWDAPAARMVANDKKIQEFVKGKVAEHRLNFDPDSLRDFIDLFLKTEKEGNEKVSQEDVFRVTVDLFLAGSEATSAVLHWFFLYMVYFPEVQKRCWRDINKVVGSGRTVSLKDKPSLNYITATLNEVLRHGSIAPFTPPHAVITPLEVNGYQLEPNDIILCHIQSCHMDSEAWDKPEEFNPDRWLDVNGALVKNPALMPFGLGPRICLGEPLVNMEAFLLSTNLLQTFEFRLPHNFAKPKLQGVQNGVTMQPPAFEVQAIPRF